VVFDKHTLAWVVKLYGDTGEKIVKQTYGDFKEGYTLPSEDNNEDYDYSYEGDNE
jgi:hypothetical protein